MNAQGTGAIIGISDAAGEFTFRFFFQALQKSCHTDIFGFTEISKTRAAALETFGALQITDYILDLFRHILFHNRILPFAVSKKQSFFLSRDSTMCCPYRPFILESFFRRI
jgi:hypothetical protein